MRYFTRLAAAIALIAGTTAFVAAAASAASASSAAPAAAQHGLVRIAHLSPQAPTMDIYLYSFGDPANPTVLKDVSYGDVSRYVQLSPGQYTVAMRGFGAPPSSHPALTYSFMVGASTAYTVAAMGPDPGLKVEVLKDRLTAPSGQALIRVLQASLKHNRVTISYGSDLLARKLGFSLATAYVAVAPGTRMVRLNAADGGAGQPVSASPDSVHTLLVLDGHSGLKVAEVTDSVGSMIMPKGGAATGFGGMAPRSPASPVSWMLLMAGGVLLIGVGSTVLRRSYRRGPSWRRIFS